MSLYVVFELEDKKQLERTERRAAAEWGELIIDACRMEDRALTLKGVNTGEDDLFGLDADQLMTVVETAIDDLHEQCLENGQTEKAQAVLMTLQLYKGEA